MTAPTLPASSFRSSRKAMPGRRDAESSATARRGCREIPLGETRRRNHRQARLPVRRPAGERQASEFGSRPPIRGQGGFTLFEMVVAVSIFALMGVMAFGGIGELSQRGQASGDANNRLSDIQFAMVYMARDWTQVSPRKIRNQFGDEESNIVLGDDVITFTRGGWSNLLGQKRSNLQRVQYQLVRDQLIRRHWLSLDQGIGEQPISQVLLDDVKSMEIVLQNALDQPIGTWPPELERDVSGAPIVLVIILELPDMGEIVRVLEIPDGVL